MFWHLILGLLRDGQPRHGYELISEYRCRSGLQVSSGNFYRDLARLTSQGYVQTGMNPPEVDTRRIPYQITERGRHTFDSWIVSPASQDEDFNAWLMFVHYVPPSTRNELLNRWQDVLWARGKALVHEREEAERAAKAQPGRSYNPLPALLLHRLKQASAELEFLKEFRSEYDVWTLAEADVALESQASPPVSHLGLRK